MSVKSISNPVKIVIVGMAGSGKTVLAATLAMKMAQMSLQNIYLAPFGNNSRQTLMYIQSNWQKLNNGQWPPSFPAGELVKQQWILTTNRSQATVQFLNCASQDIHSLFNAEKFDRAALSEDLRRIYDSVISANVLIVLVNIKDLLTSPDSTTKILDLDLMFHTLQQRSDIPRRMAIVFSQYDKYKPEVDQRFNGNFLEYIRHYLPYLYGQYKLHHTFELIPVAAVYDTLKVVENGTVKQSPAPNFRSYNLKTLIPWIANSVEQLSVEIENRKNVTPQNVNRQFEAEGTAIKNSNDQPIRHTKKLIILMICLIAAIYIGGLGIFLLSRPSKNSIEGHLKTAEQEVVDAQNEPGSSYDKAQDRKETVNRHPMAAEPEDAESLYLIGYCCFTGQGVKQDYPEAVKLFFTGHGVKQDYSEAVKWYRKSADKEYAKAQFALGACYYNGQGVTQDYAEAVKWYRKAAEQGYADAQYSLGYCYVTGEGIAQDYENAAKWFRKAAEQGNAEAQTSLGICYHDGLGIAQDYAEAAEWFRKAAEQENAKAQNNLGNCYFYGNGVTKDCAEAVKWYRKAAEQGIAEVQYNLGTCYYYGYGITKDYAEAVKWYRKAAEQGIAAAQISLGTCYLDGICIAQDYPEAVKWYRKAAEQGNAEAQNNLGVCYQKGMGVPINYTEAAKWYRKAAEQGNVEAQNNLGSCYEHGYGVTQSYVEAAKWYRKAAEQGNPTAQNNLGACYHNGMGVPQNLIEAAKWYRKAAEQGNETAKENLIRLFLF